MTVRPRGQESRRRLNRTSPCSISASRAATDTGLRRTVFPSRSGACPRAAAKRLRDKDSNPGLHVQRGVVPVRRSRNAELGLDGRVETDATVDGRGSGHTHVASPFATHRGRIIRSPSISAEEIDAERLVSMVTNGSCAERSCLCHSPTLRPWIAASGVLRGGALEPGARAMSEKLAGKSRRLYSSELPTAEYAEGPFSLRRGLDSPSELLTLGIILSGSVVLGEDEEGDPLGSPSLELVCSLNTRLQTSRRGLGLHRSGTRRRPALARGPTTRHGPLRLGAWAC
jgi:hypothetical protein